MRIEVRTNAKTYGLSYQQRAARVRPETQRAMRKIGQVALQIAREESSGDIRTGPGFRPYSRRAGFAVGENYPARINVRSGRYRSAWRLTERYTTAGTVSGNEVFTVSLRNDSPEAQWLTRYGTSVMVGRPVLELIKEKTRDTVNAEARAAVQRAIGRPVTAGAGLETLAQGSASQAGNLSGLANAFSGGFGAGFALGAGLGGI